MVSVCWELRPRSQWKTDRRLSMYQMAAGVRLIPDPDSGIASATKSPTSATVDHKGFRHPEQLASPGHHGEASRDISWCCYWYAQKTGHH